MRLPWRSPAGPDARRAAFLAGLRSGSGRYRRYQPLPLRYAGGKSLGVGPILERFPAGVERVVAPFLGGGAVEVACANGLGLPVRGYDVFAILAGYWRTQLSRPADLADRLAEMKPDQATYAEVKQRLKAHWEGARPIEDELRLAADYWFNHNLSYGPGFLGWMSRIYADPERYRRLVAKVRAFRAPTLRVRPGDFRETIRNHSGDFLYCDPPYFLGGDSRMFRGIYPQRNFPVHHAGFDHRALADLLAAHRGGFVLSYNDCSQVREWYADCAIHAVAWQYTMGQGETRIGANRAAAGAGHVKQSHELLIVREPG